jgi:hypothetical protein
MAAIKPTVSKPVYLGAEDSAPSLTGARNDSLFINIGHDVSLPVQTVPVPGNARSKCLGRKAA